jgi:alkylation response protein AidB-like acyl-CoA dehydrogenase
VGEKNRGFYQMMAQVDYERAGIERLMQNYPLFERLRTYVKGNTSLSKDSLIRDQMARLEIEFEIGRLICYRVAWVIDQGNIPNREAAMSKAFCNRVEQEIADIATQLLGPFGQVLPGSSETPLNGEAAEAYLYSPTYTLMGGTPEVLKSIVATRILGLSFKKRS